MVRSPESKVSVSPTAIFLLLTDLKYMMLPAVEASVMAKATTVGHALPVQLQLTATLLVALPAEGALNVTDWRLYPLPVISVPEVLTVGAVLYKAPYTVAGDV
jgi:hypothetical protein